MDGKFPCVVVSIDGQSDVPALVHKIVAYAGDSFGAVSPFCRSRGGNQGTGGRRYGRGDVEGPQ